MSTIRLRHINPLGAMDVPLLRRTLEAGEEFDCPVELAGRGPSVTADGEVDLGEGLLSQIGNYEHADAKQAVDVAAGAEAVATAYADAALEAGATPVEEQPAPDLAALKAEADAATAEASTQAAAAEAAAAQSAITDEKG